MESRSFIERIGGPSTVFIATVVVISIIFLGFIIFGARGGGDNLTRREEQLVQLAKDAGLDTEAFSKDIKRSDIEDRVKADIAEYAVISNGAGESTPSIFINGQREQNSDFETFRTIVQRYVDQAEASGSTAPVEIKVFEDYQCPGCAIFFPTTYLIKAEFGDKIKLMHKHLPLTSIHPRAYSYAVAAEAAREQGKFYEFSRAAFEKESGKKYTELDNLDKSVFAE